MSKLSRIAIRFWWIQALIAILVLSTAAFVLALRDQSTPIPVRTAIDRFREQTATNATTSTLTPTPRNDRVASIDLRRVEPTTTSALSTTTSTPSTTMLTRSESAGHPLPKPGVYVYRTTGGDEVDVLGGSRHRYPDTTTVTVVQNSDGCARAQWDALKERWEWWDLCRRNSGILEPRLAVYHEFFSRSDTTNFTCDAQAWVVPARPTSGWTFECNAPNQRSVLTATTIDDHSTILGVSALHVHLEATISGTIEGTFVQDNWLDPTNGLILRRITSVRSTSDTPLGRTHYREDYTIELTSLTPHE